MHIKCVMDCTRNIQRSNANQVRRLMLSLFSNVNQINMNYARCDEYWLRDLCSVKTRNNQMHFIYFAQKVHEMLSTSLVIWLGLWSYNHFCGPNKLIQLYWRKNISTRSIQIWQDQYGWGKPRAPTKCSYRNINKRYFHDVYVSHKPLEVDVPILKPFPANRQRVPWLPPLRPNDANAKRNLEIHWIYYVYDKKQDWLVI